jgi:type I restriction enzyme, S subunit
LYPQAFFEIRSPVPPIEEQRQIVDFIEKETGKTASIIAALSCQIELLDEYRTALIHECVTGQRELP